MRSFRAERASCYLPRNRHRICAVIEKAFGDYETFDLIVTSIVMSRTGRNVGPSLSHKKSRRASQILGKLSNRSRDRWQKAGGAVIDAERLADRTASSIKPSSAEAAELTKVSEAASADGAEFIKVTSLDGPEEETTAGPAVEESPAVVTEC